MNPLKYVVGWWRERRAIKATHKAAAPFADAVLAPTAEPNPMAVAKMMYIREAIAQGKPVCLHCYEPFEYQPISFPETVRLRAILMIPDKVPDPLMICRSCRETAIGAYNPQATNIGTRNDGHANLVLRQFH